MTGPSALYQPAAETGSTISPHQSLVTLVRLLDQRQFAGRAHRRRVARLVTLAPDSPRRWSS